jgi:hypothetical protein
VLIVKLMREESRFAAEPEQFDAAAALQRAEVVDRRSRAAARWPAGFWLILAAGMPIYLIGEQIAPPGPVMRMVEWSPLVVGFALFAVAVSRRSESLLFRRLTPVVTAVYIGLAVLCMLAKWLVLPDGHSFGLIVLGLLPAVPCVYGAVRILTSR